MPKIRLSIARSYEPALDIRVGDTLRFPRLSNLTALTGDELAEPPRDIVYTVVEDGDDADD